MNRIILLIQSCLTRYELGKERCSPPPLALRNTVPNQPDCTMIKRSSNLLKNLSCANRQGEKKENRQKQKIVYNQHKWRNRP